MNILKKLKNLEEKFLSLGYEYPANELRNIINEEQEAIEWYDDWLALEESPAPGHA